MFFTLNDYKKIQNWLNLHSIKDSELPDFDIISGDEYLSIVLNGKNVKVNIGAFAQLLILLGNSDFLNATLKYDAHSILEVIQSVPYKARKIGQVVTFCDNDGTWKVYQFLGARLNQWDIVSQWVDILKKASGYIVADEEDLTTVEESGNRIVKFKDRTVDDFCSTGKVYLRKNILTLDNGNTINYLSQDMISKENTIYVIRYDYDLNNQAITIPSGCILEFDGGTLHNGTLELRQTGIRPVGFMPIETFYNVTVTGNYKPGQIVYDVINESMIYYCYDGSIKYLS